MHSFLLSKRLFIILISIFLESIFIFSLKRYLLEYLFAKFALVFSKIVGGKIKFPFGKIKLP